jgi:glycosyltransferase involved in cell wall biosynthesis
MPTEAPRARTGRLAVIGPSGSLIARLRGGLIEACLARNVGVLAFAPDMGAEGSRSLILLGAEAQSIALKQSVFSPMRRAREISSLAGQLMTQGASAALIFGNHIAPMAVRAARKARVGRVILLINEIRDRKLAKGVVAAIRMSDAVIVHNDEDARLVRAAVGRSPVEVVRVTGAGIDLAALDRRDLPPLDGPIRFLAAARLDPIKGVLDFLEAARTAKNAGISAEFVLAGPEGRERNTIGADTIARYAPFVQFAGDQADLRGLIEDAHVFVCPSRCEGMPHAVLQAMAAGRPIIASDVPGVRDTVDENVNGTMVPAGDAAGLAEAFHRMVRQRTLLPAMGRASRAKAERGFSSLDVNRSLLATLRLL